MAQFISQWCNSKEGDDTVNITNIFLKKKMPVMLVHQLESVKGDQLS